MNALDLRNALLEDYQKARRGELDLLELKTTTNTAGKVIAGAKVQLEFNKHMGFRRTIKFLDIKE